MLIIFLSIGNIHSWLNVSLSSDTTKNHHSGVVVTINPEHLVDPKEMNAAIAPSLKIIKCACPVFVGLSAFFAIRSVQIMFVAKVVTFPGLFKTIMGVFFSFFFTKLLIWSLLNSKKTQKRVASFSRDTYPECWEIKTSPRCLSTIFADILENFKRKPNFHTDCLGNRLWGRLAADYEEIDTKEMNEHTQAIVKEVLIN